MQGKAPPPVLSKYFSCSLNGQPVESLKSSLSLIERGQAYIKQCGEGVSGGGTKQPLKSDSVKVQKAIQECTDGTGLEKKGTRLSE